MSNESRQAVRAVFLAAIMVISVFAAGIAFSGSAAAQQANTTTLEVTNSATDDDEYSSIPAALDAASPGDTISVQNDQIITDPNNRIVIDENASGAALDGITITASGNITVRYEQPDESAPGVNPGYPTFDVAADNVRIEGFNIELDTNDVYDGSERNAQAVKVGGYQASGGSGVKIVNNNISFVGTDNPDISTTGVGLIDPNNGGQLVDANVTGNNIQGFNTGAFAFSTDDGLSGEFNIAQNNLSSNDIQYLDNSDTVDGSAVYEFNTFDTAALLTDSSTYSDVIYSSIQDAVNDTEQGATITVASGEYSETVTLETQNVALEGPNAGTPGYEHSGDEAEINGQIIIEADGAVVDGVTVSPPDPVDNTAEAEAIRVSNNADNVIVQNNIVEDFARNTGSDFFGVDGINLFGGDSADAVENPTVQHNLVQRLQNNVSGGAAGISVQGNVENATVDRNVVENIGQEETAYGFGIVVRGTENHDVTPTNVSVSNNDVSNILSDPDSEVNGVPLFGVGVGVEASGADEVSFTGNNISNTGLLLEDKTATLTLTDFADDNTLDRGALVENVDIDGDTRNIIFDSIEDAESAAGSGSTVEVLAGNYEGPISISTQNVTIAGTTDPNSGEASTIVGQPSSSEAVEIKADEVTLDQLEIRHPTGSANAETTGFAGAVGVSVQPGNSNVTVEDSLITDIGTQNLDANPIAVYAQGDTDNITVDNNVISDLRGTFDDEDGDFTTDGEAGNPDEGAVQAILINSQQAQDGIDSPITGATVTDNEIRNLTDTRSTVAVRFNGEVSGVIAGNDIRNLDTEGDIPGTDDPGGFTQVISLAEGGNSISGPKNVAIAGNNISGIETTTEANFAPPVGIIVGGSADASTIQVSGNNIVLDRDPGLRNSSGIGILNRNEDILVAPLNWWGSDRGPKAESTNDVAGNVAYDPFLTTPIENIKVDDLGDTKQFAQDVEAPADQDVTAVGFPGPVPDGYTVGDAFENVEGGAIYEYSRQQGTFVLADSSDEISALDAFIITQNSSISDEDTQVVIEYANDFGIQDDKTIEPGFNLVGAPGLGDSYDVFNAPTDREVIYGTYGQPADRSETAFLMTENADSNFIETTFGPDQDDPVVTPYGGYLIYTEEQREIPTFVPSGVTADQVINNLNQTAA